VQATDLDPDVYAALVHLGRRELRRPRPLCPQCGHRPQATTDGLCADCTDQKRELELERKRRWWAKHGTEWRNDRKAHTKPADPHAEPACQGGTARARSARQATS
jgi:predicted amidophosphoribosyltransferase